jgi:hypothetical protein
MFYTDAPPIYFELRCVAAVSMLEHLTHAAYGTQQVPALAFGPISMSAARHVEVSVVRAPGPVRHAIRTATIARLLYVAPLNVARLTFHVPSSRALDFRQLSDAIRDNPCNSFITELRGAFADDAAQAQALVDTFGGFAHLRSLAVGGPAALELVAPAASTLRSIAFASFPGDALLLAALPRLRRASVNSCGTLARVELPPTLRRLGEGFCSQNHVITRCDLSNTQLVAVPDDFFNCCRSLVGVLLPATVRSIGRACFRECAAMACVDWAHLPAVTTLEARALIGCDALVAVALPASLTKVGPWCFARCTALKALDLSHTMVHTIANDFLLGCHAVATLALPASLATVGDRWLWRAGLTALDLSHTALHTAGDDFLLDCAALTDVVLPGSLARLGDRAFRGCTQLLSLDVSHTRLTRIGTAFMQGCAALRQVLLPAGFLALNLALPADVAWGAGAFEGCGDVARPPRSHGEIARKELVASLSQGSACALVDFRARSV